MKLKFVNLSVIIILGLIFGNVLAETIDLKEQTKKLKNKDAKIRSATVRELQKIGKNKEIIKLLTESCKTEKDANVRTEIYQTLGSIGDKDAVPLLIEKSKSENKQPARETAILALGQTQSPDAVPVLKEILLNENETFTARVQAAKGLTCIPTEESVRALEQGLKSENPRIRFQIICSLDSYVSDILFKERVEMIKNLQNDPDEKIKALVNQLLKEKYGIR